MKSLSMPHVTRSRQTITSQLVGAQITTRNTTLCIINVSVCVCVVCVRMSQSMRMCENGPLSHVMGDKTKLLLHYILRNVLNRTRASAQATQARPDRTTRQPPSCMSLWRRACPTPPLPAAVAAGVPVCPRAVRRRCFKVTYGHARTPATTVVGF